MQHIINIVPDSFDFKSSGKFNDLFLEIKESNQFIQKMKSSFNIFCHSNDFYDCCVPLLTSNYPSNESGLILNCIWDGNGIGKVGNSQYSQEEILKLVQQQPKAKSLTEYHTLFAREPNLDITMYEKYLVCDETNILEHSCFLLKHYPAEPIEYGENLTLTFKNLVFHPSFNRIENIEGGYSHFSIEITNFLSQMNSYEQSKNNVMEDLKRLDSLMLYTVCEEGGGKKKRKQGELNYEYDICGSKHSINCEFHYKLEFKDDQYKNGHYYYNRIYFGFIKTIEPMKIVIAHVGDHI